MFIPLFNEFSLQCAGIIALADAKVILHRTVLTGTASWFDIFVLTPGIHRHQLATTLCGDERPVIGAMTTGFVFRVENSGMVKYLQDVGKTGHLTTIHVGRPELNGMNPFTRLGKQGILSMSAYLSCCFLTSFVFNRLYVMDDKPGLFVLSLFVLARFINVVIVKRRTQQGWKGALEKDVKGDLLTLLTDDRWIRIQGLVDDLKATISGGWFRDETPFEKFFTSCALFTTYTAAALVGSASPMGICLIVGLLMASTGLLGLSNITNEGLQMYGRQVTVTSKPRFYKRRLDLAEELIKEVGRSDWAIEMGMIVPSVPQTPVKV